MAVFENLDFIGAQIIYRLAVLVRDYGIDLQRGW